MRPNREQLMLELESILRKTTGYKGPLSEASSLSGDLALDSLALLSLTVEIENRYKITLGDGQSVPENLGQILKMIEEKL